MSDVVGSPRNPRVVAAAKLQRRKERRERGLTLLEGPHLLAEAVEHGARILEVFGLESDPEAAGLARRCGADWVPVAPRVLDRIAPTETPRGPVAVMVIPPPVAPEHDLLWIDVADPGNAGTLIRSAAAFDLDVLAAPGSVELWAPKVLRSAAGAHFSTRLGSGAVPEEWGTVATVVEGGIDPAELSHHLDPRRPWAVLVGSEAHGLDDDTARAADVVVTIPMPGGVESLNAAVAGSIVADHLSRWRRSSGAPREPR